MFDSAQPSSPEALSDYDVRLLVAGSRGYADYRFFSDAMWATVERFGGKSIIFISGAAKTGADALIIQWCREHHLPWVEFAADWNRLGKRAGYVRNAQMAEVATDVVLFYDGVSKGTRHMSDLALKKGLPVTTILIDIIERN